MIYSLDFLKKMQIKITFGIRTAKILIVHYNLELVIIIWVSV